MSSHYWFIDPTSRCDIPKVSGSLGFPRYGTSCTDFRVLSQLEIYFHTVRLFSLCSEVAIRSAIMEVVEMESESSSSSSSLPLN